MLSPVSDSTSVVSDHNIPPAGDGAASVPSTISLSSFVFQRIVGYLEENDRAALGKAALTRKTLNILAGIKQAREQPITDFFTHSGLWNAWKAFYAQELPTEEELGKMSLQLKIAKWNECIPYVEMLLKDAIKKSKDRELLFLPSFINENTTPQQMMERPDTLATLLEGARLDNLAMFEKCLAFSRNIWPGGEVLECTDLWTFPHEITTFQNLHDLTFQSPKMFSLPGEIKALKNLRKLSLGDCKNLKSLPPEIGELTQLSELLLCGTGITSLPLSLKNLPLQSLLLPLSMINLAQKAMSGQLIAPCSDDTEEVLRVLAQKKCEIMALPDRGMTPGIDSDNDKELAIFYQAMGPGSDDDEDKPIQE